MNKYTIPTTAQQAFKILDTMISPDDIMIFKNMTPEEFCSNQHWGLGMWIRNNWIYRSAEENDEERMLLDKCYRMLAGNHFVLPDEVSGCFLKRYHKHLIQKKGKRTPL